MRSEQLESIVSLLRDSEEDGPTTVEEWRLAYDKLGSLVPPRQDIPVEPAEHVAGEWIGGGMLNPARARKYLAELNAEVPDLDGRCHGVGYFVRQQASVLTFLLTS